MDPKWWKMSILVTYWIMFISIVVAFAIAIMCTMHHSIKGIIVYIRQTIDQRHRAIRVVDSSQFEN